MDINTSTLLRVHTYNIRIYYIYMASLTIVFSVDSTFLKFCGKKKFCFQFKLLHFFSQCFCCVASARINKSNSNNNNCNCNSNPNHCPSSNSNPLYATIGCGQPNKFSIHLPHLPFAIWHLLFAIWNLEFVFAVCVQFNCHAFLNGFKLFQLSFAQRYGVSSEPLPQEQQSITVWSIPLQLCCR